ncbi:hypothetical protein PTSG_00976 [Salpingoeca rosetta]|uniref:SH2 domain-containing protein n=1 Tax=Salpingoeca rosetta (strain ATCC 50818 / BSB-021) TaxID=946362 RepID=F2TY15_SALR5|nr:uncharacterized protein PTSG_00976 [Salpingoeca rosetta]EGD76274.1 hypothetical protein PTSG_00976 [Salpingoeca rosetta]|eukprot:XP_004998449.1 hypothetical protein PTSG_00976 [Salpingoeca rosetta]
MFRNNKGQKRLTGDNSTHDKVNVPEIHLARGGFGVGTAMIGGTSAAWTKSFQRDHFDTKRGVPGQDSSDDLLANVDKDLLNPSVDDEAWAAPWYVEKIANSKVARVLADKPDGTFIIRDSSSQPGCFAMSYRFLNQMHHTLINSSAGGIHLAKSSETFPCLSELVERYSVNFDRSGDDLPCPLRTDVELPLLDNDNSASGHVHGQPSPLHQQQQQQDQQQQQNSASPQQPQSTLSRIDSSGQMLTINAETGEVLPTPSAAPATATTTPTPSSGIGGTRAFPAVPSRRTKPSHHAGVVDDMDVSSSPGGGMKAGVVLCPHCSSRQSMANMICSSCNKRLDGKEPAARRTSKAMTYTDMVPRTVYRRQQEQQQQQEEGSGSTGGEGVAMNVRNEGAALRHVQPRVSSSSSGDEEEDEEDSSDGYEDMQAQRMAKQLRLQQQHYQQQQQQQEQQQEPQQEQQLQQEQQKDEQVGDTKQKKDKKDKKEKKEKKKKKTRKSKAVEIVVDPLPAGMKGILLPEDSPKKHNISVHFDEDNITKTTADMAFIRGAAGRVDDLAWDCGYYLDDMIAKPEQAASKLMGSAAGMFVIYEHPAGEDALMLSVVGANNTVQHHVISHSYDGLQFEGQGPCFKHLSDLVIHYASKQRASSGAPTTAPALHLTEAQRDLIRRVTTATEGDLPRKRRASKDMEVPEQAERGHKGPYNKLATPDHFNQPWYQGELSRVEAVAMVEFEPSGSFVVRDNHDEPGRYILTYVHGAGELGHVEIKPYGDGYGLEEEGAIEKPTLTELVEFYASDAGLATGHLETKLRLPKGGSGVGVGAGVGVGGGQSAAALLQPPSPGGIRRASGGTSQRAVHERPGWLQTNMPKAQALQHIAGLDDGAFVIRSSETRKNCYVLSYKFHRQVHHELIKHTPPPTARFFLSRNPNKTFGSLQELVEYFQAPSQELKYPLIPAYMAASPLSRGASRRSTRASGGGSGGGGGGKPPLMRQTSRNKGLTAPEDVRRSASSLSLNGNGSPKEFTRSRSSRRSRHRESVRMARTGERLDQRAATSHWCCLNMSKEEAMGKLPQKEGAFVVRRSDDYFATLTMIANGKAHHFNIEDTTQGLRLKKSTSFQPNLSALIAYYKIPTQADLPRCLMAW